MNEKFPYEYRVTARSTRELTDIELRWFEQETTEILKDIMLGRRKQSQPPKTVATDLPDYDLATVTPQDHELMKAMGVRL